MTAENSSSGILLSVAALSFHREIIVTPNYLLRKMVLVGGCGFCRITCTTFTWAREHIIETSRSESNPSQSTRFPCVLNEPLSGKLQTI